MSRKIDGAKSHSLERNSTRKLEWGSAGEDGFGLTSGGKGLHLHHIAEEEITGINTEKTTTFEELLETQGYIVYTNVGCSMMPLLRQRRDVIEIRKKEPGRCKKYDVVLYKRGTRYILHRILKVTENGYVIAGDHNTYLEYDITDDRILGVMTRVIRDGKSITTDNKQYKLYTHIWCDFYPIRIFILKCKRLLWRILRGVKRRIFPAK